MITLNLIIGRSQSQSNPTREEEPKAYFEEDFDQVKIEKDVLSPDLDLDSATDVDDYELDDLEFLISKIDLERFTGE